MDNSKFKFLKQWFTFTFNDNKTDLVFSCSNNHYIHDWMEEHGYNKFENTLSTEDLDLFLRALNESMILIHIFLKMKITLYGIWIPVVIGHILKNTVNMQRNRWKLYLIVYGKYLKTVIMKPLWVF